MKKWLLGIVLLTALVAVSYLKTMRESEREAQAFIDGHEVASRKAELAQDTTDSLNALIDQKATALAELRSAAADTLAARDQLHASMVDSLTGIIEARQQEIAGLEKRVAAAQLATEVPPKSQKSSAHKASHKSILSHYKLAMAKLPADLSAYEYRVSVAEVRSETAARFNITVARLDEIRKANDIDY